LDRETYSASAATITATTTVASTTCTTSSTPSTTTYSDYQIVRRHLGYEVSVRSEDGCLKRPTQYSLWTHQWIQQIPLCAIVFEERGNVRLQLPAQECRTAGEDVLRREPIRRQRGHAGIR
jgi:hypothetical protein